MLQTYKTDASLLFDEYSKEYVRDMSAVESRLQDHSLINDQVNNKDTFSDDTTDTVSLDPNSKNQEWKKTEAGWERTFIRDTSAAEVTCAIIHPDSSPSFRARNAGNP